MGNAVAAEDRRNGPAMSASTSASTSSSGLNPRASRGLDAARRSGKIAVREARNQVDEAARKVATKLKFAAQARGKPSYDDERTSEREKEMRRMQFARKNVSRKSIVLERDLSFVVVSKCSTENNSSEDGAWERSANNRSGDDEGRGLNRERSLDDWFPQPYVPLSVSVSDLMSELNMDDIASLHEATSFSRRAGNNPASRKLLAALLELARSTPLPDDEGDATPRTRRRFVRSHSEPIKKLLERARREAIAGFELQQHKMQLHIDAEQVKESNEANADDVQQPHAPPEIEAVDAWLDILDDLLASAYELQHYQHKRCGGGDGASSCDSKSSPEMMLVASRLTSLGDFDMRQSSGDGRSWPEPAQPNNRSAAVAAAASAVASTDAASMAAKQRGQLDEAFLLEAALAFNEPVLPEDPVVVVVQELVPVAPSEEHLHRSEQALEAEPTHPQDITELELPTLGRAGSAPLEQKPVILLARHFDELASSRRLDTAALVKSGLLKYDLSQFRPGIITTEQYRRFSSVDTAPASS